MTQIFMNYWEKIVWIYLQQSSIKPHPRPCMAKLSPDHSLNWVFISKPVLTATIDYTTSWALQNISADNRFSESEITVKTN